MNYIIKLYITGQTPRSVRAIENLRRICDGERDRGYEDFGALTCGRMEVALYAAGALGRTGAV